MTETTQKKACVVIGAVGAGKSSYLAALWYALQRPHSSITVERFDGDREFVNDLTHAWLEWRTPLRTPGGTYRTLSVVLRDVRSQLLYRLVYPDLSGEDIESTWVERRWGNEFDKSVRGSAGIILFVHPSVRVPLQVGQSPAGWLRVVDPSRDSSGNPLPNAVHVHAAEKEDPPTAVLLADILGSIAIRRNRKPLRLSVVISAWDLIEESDLESLDSRGSDFAPRDETAPEKWLRLYLPLLHQYLTCNKSLFDSRVFGVSAQGVDLSAIDREKAAAEIVEPLDRVIVKGRGTGLRDIVAPLEWAASTDST